MKKAKWKKLYIEMYGFDIYFAVGDAKKIYKKILRSGYSISDKHKAELLGGYEGVCFPMLYEKDGFNAFLIWIPKMPETPREVACLAHECLHSTYYILNEIGIEDGIPEKYDELHTYFLDRVMEEALDFYWG